MEQHEIRIYKLFEALEINPAVSQRVLAHQLRISLGLINSITRNLVKKGYLTTTILRKNRFRYDITPQGNAEKNRLESAYVAFSMHAYKVSRELIRSVFQKLSAQHKKRIFFYGISEFAEIAYIALQETDLVLAGIIDEQRAGTTFLGIQIRDLSFLTNLFPSDVVFVTSIDRNRNASEMLKNYGVPQENLFDLRIH